MHESQQSATNQNSDAVRNTFANGLTLPDPEVKNALQIAGSRVHIMHILWALFIVHHSCLDDCFA
jgi:hypothetical protein